MASVNQLALALASSTQELTLALANLRFDFTLFKFEAPAEFAALGAALTPARRKAAESGECHITARKLGALFEDILPPVPHLVKAYGIRSSEIAESEIINPANSKSYGPFSEHVGFDGTSIWASATSGDSAIAVHLLACMLARRWPPAEAIAAWEEIVGDRQRELRNYEGRSSIRIESIQASNITVTRQQLKDWDASARAWLSAADKVKGANQTQLMLILSNIQVPVNTILKTYGSVLSAWETAMVTLDQLINGSPHVVASGAVLLGISAWHLYPDMTVLSTETKDVRYQDSLIKSAGHLTVGLERRSPSAEFGVYWSLPLTKLRYYGDAVDSKMSLSIDSSRVSFEQFVFAALGSASVAFLPTETKTEAIASFFCNFGRYARKEELFSQEGWPVLLADAARRLADSQDSERDTAIKLIHFGQRNHKFLHSSARNSVFGPETHRSEDKPTANKLLGLLKNQSDKINLLRKVASKLGAPDDELVVRFRCRDFGKSEVYAYSTIGPGPRKGSVKLNPLTSGQRITSSLLNTGNTPEPAQIQIRPEDADFQPLYFYATKYIEPDASDARKFAWHNPPEYFGRPSFVKNRSDFLYVREESTAGRSYHSVIYWEFLYGDLEEVALFKRAHSWVHIQDELIGFDEAEDALSSGTMSPRSLIDLLSNLPNLKAASSLLAPYRGNLLRSLRALARAAEVYRRLRNATVDLSLVVHQNLGMSKWASCSENPKKPLGRPRAFACIAMFESGTFDFDPDSLRHVMALCFGDSLFVVSALLNDPTEFSTHMIQRIPGNIGRAGMAMLIPPSSPQVRGIDPTKWSVVNHDSFDGKLEDNFDNTTLHLSFTGYEWPLDASRLSGSKHVEAYFLETLISVFNSGDWVADLDVLGTFTDRNLRVADGSAFVNLEQQCCENALATDPGFKAVSIDNWEELLDRPEGCGVVRAHGNWLGRLAITAVCVRQGYLTVLLPSDKYCWHCLRDRAAAILDVEGNDSESDGQLVFKTGIFVQ